MGSEMCIRDSPQVGTGTRNLSHIVSYRQAEVSRGTFDGARRGLLTSAPTLVSTRDDEGDLIPGIDESDEERYRQLGGPKESQASRDH